MLYLLSLFMAFINAELFYDEPMNCYAFIQFALQR